MQWKTSHHETIVVFEECRPARIAASWGYSHRDEPGTESSEMNRVYKKKGFYITVCSIAGKTVKTVISTGINVVGLWTIFQEINS